MLISAYQIFYMNVELNECSSSKNKEEEAMAAWVTCPLHLPVLIVSALHSFCTPATRNSLFAVSCGRTKGERSSGERIENCVDPACIASKTSDDLKKKKPVHDQSLLLSWICLMKASQISLKSAIWSDSVQHPSPPPSEHDIVLCNPIGITRDPDLHTKITSNLM